MARGRLAVTALLSAMALAGCSSPGDVGTVVSSASDSLASSSSAAGSRTQPAPSDALPDLPSDLVFQGDRVMVKPADGTSARALTSDDGPPHQEHPDWSPDGSHVVFDSGFSTLWTARFDGEGLEQIYECLDPCYVVQDGAWSPDGRSIAFMEGTGDGTVTTSGKIQILTIDTKTVRTVFEDTTGTGLVSAPRWSPDGRSIVFEADTYASNKQTEEKIVRGRIGIIGVDGPPEPRFIASGTDQPASTPDWSRTGGLVVFSKGDNLVTVRPDGSKQHVITKFNGKTEHAIQPTFAPSGDLIVFTYVTGTFDVDDKQSAATVDLKGNDLTILAGQATHPRLRP